MTSSDTKTVGIYCRISAADDTENVDRQERRCKEYAQKQGWTVAHVFTDNSVSGGKRDRPGFLQLLSHVENQEVDIVLATAVDRFSRNEDDDRLLRAITQKAGAKIWTISGGELKLNTHTDILIAGIMALFAQYERDIAAYRQKMKKRDKLAQGDVLPARYRLFGYADKTKQTLHPNESKTVIEIFEMFNKGVGLFSITSILNERNIPMSTGSRWDIRGVRGILTNESYCGWSIIDGEVMTKNGKWKTIIDSQTFETAQKRLESQKTKPAKKGNKPKRILSGKLVCANTVNGDLCLQTLVLNNERYRCQPGQKGCGKNNINADKIDKYILENVIKPALDKMPERIQPQVDNSEEIERIDGELERLRDLYKMGDYTVDEYKTERDELKEQRESLISETSAAAPVVSSYENFCKSDLATQQEVVNQLIPGSILIKPNNGGGHKLDPNRVSFE